MLLITKCEAVSGCLQILFLNWSGAYNFQDKFTFSEKVGIGLVALHILLIFVFGSLRVTGLALNSLLRSHHKLSGENMTKPRRHSCLLIWRANYELYLQNVFDIPLQDNVRMHNMHSVVQYSRWFSLIITVVPLLTETERHRHMQFEMIC